MDGDVHRPCYRADDNEKHEDKWWINKKRDDRATAADIAPFDANLPVLDGGVLIQ